MNCSIRQWICPPSGGARTALRPSSPPASGLLSRRSDFRWLLAIVLASAGIASPGDLLFPEDAECVPDPARHRLMARSLSFAVKKRGLLTQDGSAWVSRNRHPGRCHLARGMTLWRSAANVQRRHSSWRHCHPGKGRCFVFAIAACFSTDSPCVRPATTRLR